MDEKNTQKEISTDEIRHCISAAISNYHKAVSRFESELKPGFHRCRSGYDRLIEKGLLTTDYIFNEYPAILKKQSTLPAAMRGVIKAIGDEALWMLQQREKQQPNQ